MFNPRPQVQVLSFPGGGACLVIDEALADPGGWRALAGRHAAEFGPGPPGFGPARRLPLPGAIATQAEVFFSAHARERLGMRRTRDAWATLSLLDAPPEALPPRYWIPRRLPSPPGEGRIACTVFLSSEPVLGGLALFRPRRPEAEMARLEQDVAALPPADLARRYGLEAGYPAAGNAWLEKAGRVEPRYNRMVLFDAGQFHAEDVLAPERLSGDPARGRLTLDVVFACRRPVSS